MLRAAVLALVLLFAADPAAARPRAPAEPAASGRVAEVVDGDTVALDGGAEVRLVGIQAPKLPLGRPNFRAWPLAPEAKSGLDRLALGKTATLSYGGARVDRHGRLLAHLHVGGEAGGTWVQGEMLRLGLARVYTFHDNRSRAAEMLALEREARSAGRGIWGHPYYRVLDATETPKFIDTFQLVEGRVVAAAVVKRRGYLNFGDDWKSDFTVIVPPNHLRDFAAAGTDVASYAGKRMRVRGWLKSRNGPMIEATHPEQIEVLEP
jgi:endonuclease YncB( thermonuclease family)